tara:strand:- start:94 stop:1182 length:1089 start_codon:yes stop_codon:yes gene_type:complete
VELKSCFRNSTISTISLIVIILLISIISDKYLAKSFLFAPLFISLIISAITIKWFIPILNNLKAKQIIREEGPKAHQKKSGTPTMGGLIIIPITIITSNLFTIQNEFYGKIIAISFITLAFMLIGTLDDWISISQKTNSGLSPRIKLILQGISSMIFFIWTNMKGWIDPIINLPFGIEFNTGILILPITLFVFLAESNATNLTDGLDGLASGCGALVFSGLALEILLRGNNENYIMSSFCASMAGGWLGFLLYNKNPAKVFMGDTGSLSMGAGLAGVALLSNNLWSLLIMGGIFLIESLSVIIQVIFFKATKKKNGLGRRIFLMTPLHHHYEISGIDENIIVNNFWITTASLVGITLVFNAT